MMFISFIDANDVVVDALLEGSSYQVGLSWNETAGNWTLNLVNFQSEILLYGIPCRVNWPLLYQFRSPRLPPGELIVDAPLLTKLDRDSFSSGRANLVYVTAAEMTAAGYPGYEAS